jgi:D-xylose transport system substrate-binding protein
MRKKFKSLKINDIMVFIFFAFFSCQTNQNKIKIGFLQPQLQTDRYVKEQNYFIQKIGELGGEALTASAEEDDHLQIQQAQELINKDVKVLVVNSVNLNTAAAIVRAAHDKGVKVIAYDRLIKNCDLDYFITFDSKKVGKLMAEYITKIKPQGKYILLGGDKADQNAVLVKTGQLDVLKPFLNTGGIQVVSDIYVEAWSGDNARQEIKKFIDLSGITPDAILSSNDAMALGVIDLLMEYKLQGKVLITGQDALLASCLNIIQGNQTMTVYKSVKTLANKAAELAMKLANNEKISDTESNVSNGIKEVPSILLDPVVVDKNNMKTTVIADGFHEEKEIF